MDMDNNVAARTDVGRIRTNNEDAYLSRPDLGLYIVCDGMGGHAAGEVASAKTCEIIADELEKSQSLRQKLAESGASSDARKLKDVVGKAIQKATKVVYKMADSNPEMEGMGCTCTMMLMAGHKAIFGHVGDSRLYMFRQGRVHQLTEDHTYVNEMVKRGVMTKDEAQNHPQGNVLSRAVGVQPTIAVDTLVFDIDPGDFFLLCSDGLHNYYPNSDELLNYITTDHDGSLNSLINTALDRGGHDNCTGILLQIPGVESQPAIAASDRINILKRIPLFAYLNYGELVKVLGITQLKQIEAEDIFVQEGERGDEFYVLLSGEVDVLKGDQIIAQLKAGVHIGEMALVDNAPRSASIKATSPINVLVMKRKDFFWIIRNEPVIASKLLWSFVQELSNRLRATNEALQGAKAQLNEDEIDDIEILFEDEE